MVQSIWCIYDALPRELTVDDQAKNFVSFDITCATWISRPYNNTLAKFESKCKEGFIFANDI